MPDGLKLPVYILAGGKSSRFGSDKARAQLQGQPLLSRLTDLIAPIASSITAIAQVKGEYSDLGVRTITDIYQNAGPLAGIHAALSDAKMTATDEQIPNWVLVLSCDLVAFDCGWCELLASHRNQTTKAIVFRHEKWEPLIGLYRSDLLEDLRQHLENRHLSLQKLLDDVGAQAVETPKNWPSVVQVNTPDDLLAYQQSGNTIDSKFDG